MSIEKIVWDIEANGLLEDSTLMWCLAFINIDTKEEKCYKATELNKQKIENIFKDKVIIGHNIIGYDIPMLLKFYNVDLLKLIPHENIIDTYLWSQVLYPDRPLPKGCPTSIKNPITNKSKKIGPHGLEAWGYRTGRKKIEIHDWLTWDPSIIERCIEDVKITIDAYNLLLKEGNITI